MPRMTPVNMSVEGVHAAAGVPASQPMPAVPSADELDNWAQDNYSVSISAAVNLGFLCAIHGYRVNSAEDDHERCCEHPARAARHHCFAPQVG